MTGFLRSSNGSWICDFTVDLLGAVTCLAGLDLLSLVGRGFTAAGGDLGEKLRGARRAVGAMDEGVRERSPRGNFWRPRPLLFRKR